MKLKVKENSWSGWSKDYKPVENLFEYELIENEKNIVAMDHISHKKNDKWIEEDVERFSFVISEVGSDYIVINTNQPMSNQKGSINLYSKEKKFKIEKNTPLILTTLTMDFGYIYTFELV